ncbi:MAG TPA: hypothetical protein VK476_06750 [Flavobacterium sp.]|nr:hypothetical protein [Flavobacterium sp.]
MNFKKHICLFLAFFLLVSNSGMAFNVHYCGDEIASVSIKTTFIAPDFEVHCCGVIETKSNCCKNKVVLFEKKLDNLILKAYSFNALDSFVIQESNPLVFPEKQIISSIRATSYFCDAHAPPLFKQYHQYIFYA